MEFRKIRCTVDNGIGSIVLNNPEGLNAFDEIMIDDILCGLELCKNDDKVKVVVIRAEGRVFSCGGDIKEMQDGLDKGRIVFETTVPKVGAISINIKKMPKPVITSVNGVVSGAAFNIALASDFCIVAENAKFIQSFVKIGLIPDAGGIYLLTKAVGVNRTNQLIFTGKIVNAKEALDLGIAYKICELAQLKKETLEFAKELLYGPLISYKHMKELIYKSQFSDFEDHITREVASQIACGNTLDFKEGITAFMEKRTPNFKGS